MVIGKKKICTILILIVLANTGCATLFRGTKDTISVRSDDPDAKIFIDERYIGKGTAIQSVPKKGNHIIRVSKKGCADATQSIPYSFDPTSLLGILIDLGIISMLVVDGLATGAISSADQTNFVLNPECVQSAKN
ncbi:MAG: PEGA domain-containing protein [Bacteriovoracia bacterium]